MQARQQRQRPMVSPSRTATASSRQQAPSPQSQVSTTCIICCQAGTQGSRCALNPRVEQADQSWVAQLMGKDSSASAAQFDL